MSVLLRLLLIFLIIVSCSGERERQEPSQKRTAPVRSDVGTGPEGSPVVPESDDPLRGEGGVSSPSGHREAGQRVGANSPPVIRDALLQMRVRDNRDLIEVQVEAKDRDGDEVTFDYEWFVNGVLAGRSESLTGFKRGDVVTVRVTPFDGFLSGKARTFRADILNTIPRIERVRQISSGPEMAIFQVEAFDADGDELVYRLIEAPEGVEIDDRSGRIRWRLPRDREGTFPIEVGVSDGHGGQSIHDFSVTVTLAETP